ncbi:C40 family peptidase [Antrihabitans sp. YC2-6]|nr:NlpC/P60 family protein [Antrihabitans sp. YC2-6]MBJ8343243.1 C40 family peptidase [Antrihabitans sp. YC2-6]
MRSVRRTAAGAIAVSLLSIAVVTLPNGPALADPASTPGNSNDAIQQLTELARQSEQLNESLHNAQIELDKKLADQNTAETKRVADQQALESVNAKIAEYQPVIDSVAVANYRGASTTGLFAVLTSDSPQQLLDQMSMLNVISTSTAEQVGEFKQARTDAATAESASRASAEAARGAVEQAKAVSDELQKKQSELDASIAQVLQAWTQLSTAEQGMFAGSALPPGFDPLVLLQGLTGGGVDALRAGITKIGSPYSWGATGPGSFDCSGLVVWAYRQIGKNLPRSSQAQMAGGTPVDKKDLQPGDVVGFYSDASHVGIYAGNGMLLHASTFGVPVAIVPLSAGGPYYGARRY